MIRPRKRRAKGELYAGNMKENSVLSCNRVFTATESLLATDFQYNYVCRKLAPDFQQLRIRGPVLHT